MILEKIKEIEQHKRDSKIFPTYATFIQLMDFFNISDKELKEKLNLLFLEEKIKIGKTLNGNWIEST